jgi:hypothetical protein
VGDRCTAKACRTGHGGIRRQPLEAGSHHGSTPREVHGILHVDPIATPAESGIAEGSNEPLGEVRSQYVVAAIGVLAGVEVERRPERVRGRLDRAPDRAPHPRTRGVDVIRLSLCLVCGECLTCSLEGGQHSLVGSNDASRTREPPIANRLLDLIVRSSVHGSPWPANLRRDRHRTRHTDERSHRAPHVRFAPV